MTNKHDVIYGQPLRSKGLVTNYGEGRLENGRGGGMWSFTPTKRGGGAEKVLAMLKGGYKKFWGRFYAVAWSILKGGGGVKSFHSLKGGAQIFLHSLEGGGRKKFWTRDFPIL